MSMYKPPSQSVTAEKLRPHHRMRQDQPGSEGMWNRRRRHFQTREGKPRGQKCPEVGEGKTQSRAYLETQQSPWAEYLQRSPQMRKNGPIHPLQNHPAGNVAHQYYSLSHHPARLMAWRGLRDAISSPLIAAQSHHPEIQSQMSQLAHVRKGQTQARCLGCLPDRQQTIRLPYP